MNRVALRKWSRRAGVSLALGAVGTVLVAWWFALLANPISARPSVGLYRTMGANGEARYAQVMESFGRWTASVADLPKPKARDADDPAPRRPPPTALDAPSPWWGGRLPSWDEARATERSTEIKAYGWPRPAVWRAEHTGFDGSRTLERGVWLWRRGMNDDRALPLGILPRGFVVNTLVMSPIAYALAFGIWDVQRASRRGRGLCPGCGHDLKGEFGAGCAECGWNRAPR